MTGEPTERDGLCSQERARKGEFKRHWLTNSWKPRACTCLRPAGGK